MINGNKCRSNQVLFNALKLNWEKVRVACVCVRAQWGDARESVYMCESLDYGSQPSGGPLFLLDIDDFMHSLFDSFQSPIGWLVSNA